MNPLRLGLLLQLVFFTAWGGALLRQQGGETVLWLETDPVDPRDFLSGHYVTLAYPIARNLPSDCLAGRKAGERLYLRLAPSGKFLTVKSGPVEAWSAAECSAAAPETGPGVWVEATVSLGRRSPPLRLGIERFYVNEKSPLREALSGQLAARATVNRRGRLKVLELAFR